jgi:signal peptidase I
MREFIFGLWEVIEVVIIALAMVFVMRSFIVQPFLISGSSMLHTFFDGDYVLVDELTYRFKEPERGDIIVFRFPLSPNIYYIKRVIGVRGDRVVVSAGEVKINDKKIKEDYLDKGMYTNGKSDVFVGDNQVFVMGDNRTGSSDSRIWGFVPYENIIGVVRLRLLPLNKVHIFNRPIYNLD